MANFTENYNLEKPNEDEKYNINVFNSNADIIDNALANKLDNASTDNFAKETSIQELTTKLNTISADIEKIVKASPQKYDEIKMQTTSFNMAENSEKLFFNIQGSGYLYGCRYIMGMAQNSDLDVSGNVKIIVDDDIIFNNTHVRKTYNTNPNICYGCGLLTSIEFTPYFTSSSINYHMYASSYGGDFNYVTNNLRLSSNEQEIHVNATSSEIINVTTTAKPIRFENNFKIYIKTADYKLETTRVFIRYTLD